MDILPAAPGPSTSSLVPQGNQLPQKISGWQTFWLVVAVLFVVGLILPDDSSSSSDTGSYNSDTTSSYTSDNPARQRCLDGLANVASWDDLSSTLATDDCAK